MQNRVNSLGVHHISTTCHVVFIYKVGFQYMYVCIQSMYVAQVTASALIRRNLTLEATFLDRYTKGLNY